jgi:hypothetical protein
VSYKRASVVGLASHTFQSPYSFPHSGSLQECVVFNEAELMYPEASIKLHSPKNSHHDKVEPANKVSSKFDKHLYANFEKTSDEKRGTQKYI